MPYITAEEWQLLSFFEVHPELRDCDVPWCYNDALYTVQQGEFKLSFAISPSYRDVRLILMHRGTRLYELNAMGVKDVRYRNENKVEELQIEISDLESLSLQLKPHIELVHQITERV